MESPGTGFHYAPDPLTLVSSIDFHLQVPPGIRNKWELWGSIAAAGRFPAYFGNNWDALLDCLRDLSWIGERRIVITHSDIPIPDNAQDLRVYIEILCDALSSWGTCDGHELAVTFPSSWEQFVEDIRAGYGDA